MHRSVGSPAIKNGLLFIADVRGLVHCLDAKDGTIYWTCDVFSPCWETPLIVGETVYVPGTKGNLSIFALSADPSESVTPDMSKFVRLAGGPSLADHYVKLEVDIQQPTYTTPVVANDVLSIATTNELFAIAAGESGPRNNPPKHFL